MFLRTITTIFPRTMTPIPTDETASEGGSFMGWEVGKRKMEYDKALERALDERGDSGYDLDGLKGNE